MIVELLLFVFLFFSFMLWHELFHVKGQGLYKGGNIEVGTFDVFDIHASVVGVVDHDWLFFSGGVLSSLLCCFLFVLSLGSVFSYGLFVNMWVQLCYGCYEGFRRGHVGDFRFVIYVLVFLVCSIVWWRV